MQQPSQKLKAANVNVLSLSFSLADSEAVEVLWQVRAQRRQVNPVLPETVTRLSTPEGSIVYLVGTAHFSDSSKNDVATVIRANVL